MAEPKDYYAVLQVNRQADAAQLKRSYRKLSKQYHPDMNPGDKAAEEKFKQVSEAYAILGNEAARKKYDEEQVGRARGAARQDELRRTAQQQRSEGYSGEFDFGRVNRQFEQFFGFSPDGDRIAVGAAGRQKNPLDTSHIFESFFQPKKR